MFITKTFRCRVMLIRCVLERKLPGSTQFWPCRYNAALFETYVERDERKNGILGSLKYISVIVRP